MTEYPLLAAFDSATRAELIAQFERGVPLSVQQADELGVPHLAGMLMTPRGESGGLVAYLVHRPQPARVTALGDILRLALLKGKSA